MTRAFLVCVFAIIALSSSTWLKAQTPQTSHERVARLLEEGLRASASNTPADAQRLATVAHTLALLGAHPADGTEDLAQQWSALARARGSTSETPAYRGRALGPSYRRARIDRRNSDKTSQLFLAGQPAIVTLVPPTHAAISLRVVDPAHRETCEIKHARKRGSCQWTPVYTERYQIALSTEALSPVDAYVIVN